MLVYVQQLGGNFAFITPVSNVDPGFGVGRPPVDPGYGGGFVPPPRPDNGLPWAPVRPGNALPGTPGTPGNELPSGPPPYVPSGQVVVLVRDAAGVWHYKVGPADVITPLPEAPPAPPTAAPKV